MVLSVVRSSSRAEQVGCGTVLMLLLVCSLLILYYAVWSGRDDAVVDIGK